MKVAIKRRGARIQNVTAIEVAGELLLSDEWPTHGPGWERAAKAIIAARAGEITPNEAREAFEAAAVEAKVLVR